MIPQRGTWLCTIGPTHFAYFFLNRCWHLCDRGWYWNYHYLCLSWHSSRWWSGEWAIRGFEEIKGVEDNGVGDNAIIRIIYCRFRAGGSERRWMNNECGDIQVKPTTTSPSFSFASQFQNSKTPKNSIPSPHPHSHSGGNCEPCLCETRNNSRNKW